MAVSSAYAENMQPSISLSGAVSSTIESFTSTMTSAISSAVALANGTAMEQVEAQGSSGLSLGLMILFMVKVIPGSKDYSVAPCLRSSSKVVMTAQAILSVLEIENLDLAEMYLIRSNG